MADKPAKTRTQKPELDVTMGSGVRTNALARAMDELERHERMRDLVDPPGLREIRRMEALAKPFDVADSLAASSLHHAYSAFIGDTTAPFETLLTDGTPDRGQRATPPLQPALPQPTPTERRLQTEKRSAAPTPIHNAGDLGALVRTARKRMGLNQQAFADLAGVGRGFISELERGKRSLEFDKVLKVAAAAGIDLSARTRAS